MIKKMLSVVGVFLAFCIILSILPLNAQNDADRPQERDHNEYKSVITNQKERREDTISKWETDAFITRLLTVIVALLGVGTAALQPFKVPGKRIVLAVVGFAIAAIAVISSEVYRVDYYILKQTSKEARFIMEDVNLKFTENTSSYNEEALNAWGMAVREDLKSIDALEADLLAKSASP